MADIVRGSETPFRFKQVTAVAETPSGGAYQSAHFYTEAFDPGEGLVDDEELGGDRHNLVDSTQPAKDLPKPTGGLAVPLDLNQFGWWLAAMWGAPVTDDVADPVFQHVFSSGGTGVKLRTLELPLTSNVFRIVDAMGVTQMTIPFTKEGGFRKVDMQTMQRSVRRVAAKLSATLVEPPARAKVTGAKGILKVDGVNLGNVLGGAITMSNGGFMESYSDDTEFPSAVEIGRPSLTLNPQIRVRQDVKAVLDKFDGVTPFGIEVLFQRSADSLLKIACTNVVAPPVLPSAKGVGAMDVTPMFTASQTDAAPMVTITLRNAVESYA